MHPSSLLLITVSLVFTLSGTSAYIRKNSKGEGDTQWDHRRRKRGGKGATRPPNFTHCLHNELHCSIVDRIACRHCSSRKTHFCCLKKMSPPPPPPSQNIFLRLWGPTTYTQRLLRTCSDQLICDKRIQEYGAECVVGEPSYVVKKKSWL